MFVSPIVILGRVFPQPRFDLKPAISYLLT
jgi:hypothetical protein